MAVATGGLKVFPMTRLTIARCWMCWWFLAVGGLAVRANDRLIVWVEERTRQVTTLTSVCTGSLLFGKAGLLTASGRLRTGVFWMRCEDCSRLSA